MAQDDIERRMAQLRLKAEQEFARRQAADQLRIQREQQREQRIAGYSAQWSAAVQTFHAVTMDLNERMFPPFERITFMPTLPQTALDVIGKGQLELRRTDTGVTLILFVTARGSDGLVSFQSDGSDDPKSVQLDTFDQAFIEDLCISFMESTLTSPRAR